jgi:TatD DNase family protein
VIDFHCHFDLYPDPEREIEAADNAGIYALSVTTTPKAWNRTNQLASGRKRIRTALGLHPELAHERRAELALFEALVPRVRYIGEIGLDGAGDPAHASDQLHVFRTILEFAAAKGGRILTIHSRRAVDEVLSELAGNPNAGIPVLHWFSGTAAQLRRAVELGCWFSVGPAMLRGKNGRALASAMPQERVLTETDGPFGRKGREILRPNDSWLAVDSLHQIWNCPAEEVKQRLLANLKNLRTLLPPTGEAAAS